MKINFASVGLALTLSGVASSAMATPRPLPFTYPYETLGEGELEVELYTDVNPLRVPESTAPGSGNLWAPEYRLQTEIEYGVSNRVELGFYQVFEAAPQIGGDNAMVFDGLKWRVRTRLAEAGEWPVDVGLFLELETMHDEVAVEGKINLQRRIGRARWMANLWAEEAFTRPWESKAHGRAANFIVNPTTGVVFEVTPGFQPGVELWARGQLSPSGDTAQDRSNSKIHTFVGPTVHANFGKLWWTAGLYFQAGNMTTPEPGDAYGPVWFRSVLGLDL